MSLELEQRFQQAEQELATIRQLMFGLVQSQQTNTEAISQLQEQQRLTATSIDRLVQSQQLNSSSIAQLEQLANQTTSKLDASTFAIQRLLTQHAERLDNVEGLTESLTAIMQRLDRNYQIQQHQIELQQQQFAEFQSTTTAALERMDRILDYLMRQG